MAIPSSTSPQNEKDAMESLLYKTDSDLLKRNEKADVLDKSGVIPSKSRGTFQTEAKGLSSIESFGGGVYIPPAKRRRMIESSQVIDPVQSQRRSWYDQKRIIHGTINRLNTTTIKPLIGDLFEKVNLLRMRGILAKNLLQATVTSPRYADVYAALVAVVNSKLPELGELVLNRAILAFRRHYRRREKDNCLAMAMFLGQLFHQAVAHELLVLQILTLLLDGDPTDDSVEVAVQFLKTTGNALLEVSPRGVRAVIERLRSLLHEGHLNKRVEHKMEQLLKLRRNEFKDNPPLTRELDLVERDSQVTFETSLDNEDLSKDDHLDIFRVDNDFEKHEETWGKIRSEILGLSDNEEDESGEDETDDDADDDEEDDSDASEQELATGTMKSQTITTIEDLTEADLVHLRRQIYLTIMSSATFEECAHKLTKIHIPFSKESELINMIIECCSQERTFLRYYGLIGARFCLLDNRWRDAFLEAFEAQYTTIHRLETNKLRNVAKLFAHLLHTDAVPWSCLSVIHLNEDETTSSSRIFVKILIQEMAEAIGIARLKQRLETDEPVVPIWFQGMFPRDDVRKTRYAINFFTSIGLGPLTDGLREFLKNAPRLILAKAQAAAAARKNDDDSSVSSSSSSSSSSDSSSSSSSFSSSSYTSSSTFSSSSDDTGSSSESSSSSSSSRSSRRRYRRRRQQRQRSPSSRNDRPKSHEKRKDVVEQQRSQNQKKSDGNSKRRDGKTYNNDRDHSKDSIHSSEDSRERREKRRIEKKSNSHSEGKTDDRKREGRKKKQNGDFKDNCDDGTDVTSADKKDESSKNSEKLADLKQNTISIGTKGEDLLKISKGNKDGGGTLDPSTQKSKNEKTNQNGSDGKKLLEAKDSILISGKSGPSHCDNRKQDEALTQQSQKHDTGNANKRNQSTTRRNRQKTRRSRSYSSTSSSSSSTSSSGSSRGSSSGQSRGSNRERKQRRGRR